MLEELIESHSHWIVFLSIPGALILAAIIIHMSHRMTRRKLEPIALALGGETIISFLKGAYVQFLNYGTEVRVRVTMGGQNSPPYLIIEQDVPIGFDLSISSENIATRKLEKWGLLNDIKVGDPVFDDSYLIRSSDPMRAQTFLMDQNRRAAVNHFFEHGFSEIVARKDSVTIRKAGYDNKDLDPELVRSHLERLQGLVTE